MFLGEGEEFLQGCAPEIPRHPGGCPHLAGGEDKAGESKGEVTGEPGKSPHGIPGFASSA
jgi:hypothetical protein